VRLHHNGEGLAVEDLSGLGFRINGTKHREVAPLGAGDQMRVGRSTFRVSRRMRVGNPEPSMAKNVGQRRLGDGKSKGEKRNDEVEVEGEKDVGGWAPPRERVDTNLKPPPLAVQHVWFELARDESWRSMALVPTDSTVNTLDLVHGFAQMAALNPNNRVLVVDVTLAGDPTTDPVVSNVASAVRTFPGARYDYLDSALLGMNTAELAHIYVPQLLDYIASESGRYNRVLLALGNLLEHATSIPIARAVEKVLLCVGQHTSRLTDVRRLPDIIGAERIAGSIVVDAG